MAFAGRQRRECKRRVSIQTACSVMLGLAIGVAGLLAVVFYHHVNRVERVASVSFTAADERVESHVDKCLMGQHHVYIEGWMLRRDQQENTPIDVYVKGDSGAWLVLGSRVMQRPDVERRFGLAYRGSSAVGFSAAARTREVSFPVRLLLVKRRSGDVSYGVQHVCRQNG